MNFKKKSVVLIAILAFVLLVSVNIFIQKNMDNKESKAGSSKKNITVETIEQSMDTGNPRLYTINNESRFIFYDNATFNDNFDDFKVTLNPISLSNKMQDDNGKDVNAIGIAFSIENASNSTFQFNTNDTKVETNQMDILTPAPGSNTIKQSEFKPTDKLSNGSMVFFTSVDRQVESLDWIQVEFKINKLNSNGDITKSKKYNIRFNINEHYKDEKSNISSEQVPPKHEKANTVETPKENTSNSEPKVTDSEKQMKKYSLESDISNLIKKDITNAEINKIEVNENLGSSEEGDYVALIYLKYKPKNSNETTLKLIDMYNNEIGAQLAKNKELTDITIFWEAPYIKENMNVVKANLQRSGDNMVFKDVWVAPLMKK
ncbi:hypothetical protein COE51_06245 [Bacillus pseudomycoides]|nr:hypothetical protein COE51_06245 [Bacillus pseudomycoides]